jgi:hypothetical protein
MENLATVWWKKVPYNLNLCSDSFHKTIITLETKNSVSMILRALYSHERVLEYN